MGDPCTRSSKRRVDTERGAALEDFEGFGHECLGSTHVLNLAPKIEHATTNEKRELTS